MNNDLRRLSPFKRLCITIGNLPTAYIESMSYYEGLTYLVNYLCNNVIPAVNNNSEVVEEVQAKFEELQSYVDNYFENIDVQEEINNKLDEMAEDGKLSDIILDYLNMSSLLMFDTVSDLKGADNFIDGSFAKTLGSVTYNDKLGACYKIRTKVEADVPDDYNLVALTNYPSLIAERILQIYEDEISDIESDLGDIDNLTTTSKSNVVSALNEVNSLSHNVNDKVGNLANLTTTVKSNVVNALNEVNGVASQISAFNLSVYNEINRSVSDSDTDNCTLGRFNSSTNTFTTSSSNVSNVAVHIYTATNTNGSIGKIYGTIVMQVNYNVSGTNFPCIRIKNETMNIATPDAGFTIFSAGNDFGKDRLDVSNIYVGSDGYTYLYGRAFGNYDNEYKFTTYPPCIYFFTDFGNTPE